MAVQQTLRVVQSGLRVTLVDWLGVKEGEQVVFERQSDGSTTICKFSGLSRVKLYGVVIGQCSANKKFYGVHVDENGNILARQRASSLDFLKKDLGYPDAKGMTKLDKVCGNGMWERPIVIDDDELDELPAKTLKSIMNLKRELKAGTWPSLPTEGNNELFE